MRLWRPLGSAALLLGACGATPAPVSPEELGRMDEVVLERPGLRAEAAVAWLSDDGPIEAQQTSLHTDAPPPLDISGQTSHWRLRDEVVVFEGDVVAVRGEVTLTCDRLEVRYAGERVETAIATGSVRVVRGERVADAREGLLTTGDGSVVLTGEPRLREGPHTMQGERITLYLDDDEATCEACRLVVDGQAVAPK